ncbi:hypothetical protein R3P38DRAFT_2787429 [Favolaschia claudopus]|uniref:Uncharacterized protein n=1 Tax=Favolaschia claudopus TaxID=2862362 RepID=A0AAW0ANZ9_9AGAR
MCFLCRRPGYYGILGVFRPFYWVQLGWYWAGTYYLVSYKINAEALHSPGTIVLLLELPLRVNGRPDSELYELINISTANSPAAVVCVTIASTCAEDHVERTSGFTVVEVGFEVLDPCLDLAEQPTPGIDPLARNVQGLECFKKLCPFLFIQGFFN